MVRLPEADAASDGRELETLPDVPQVGSEGEVWAEGEDIAPAGSRRVLRGVQSSFRSSRAGERTRCWHPIGQSVDAAPMEAAGLLRPRASAETVWLGAHSSRTKKSLPEGARGLRRCPPHTSLGRERDAWSSGQGASRQSCAGHRRLSLCNSGGRVGVGRQDSEGSLSAAGAVPRALCRS